MDIIGNRENASTSPARDPARSVTLREVPLPGPLAPAGRLDAAVGTALSRLLGLQSEQGYWVFDLEADATIPSEYVMLQRFLGRDMRPELKDKIARYLRNRQLPDGGWPLYTEGPADLSCTVKAYFALKLLGDAPDAPHLARARQRVLEMGGAEKVNVFTRITLAIFGQIPWRTAPCMPIEITMLPDWFFFHLRKVSYWSRTVVVPLLILYARRPVAHIEPDQGVRELFLQNPENLRNLDGFCVKSGRKNLFILLDRILKCTEGCLPVGIREEAVRRAERWTVERMRGEGGIGAIFPAMANAVMALRVLGYPDSQPDMARGIKALDDLLVEKEHEAFCQPCVSPIWDSCLSLSASLEAGASADSPAMKACVDWLFSKQVFAWGDWAQNSPGLQAGAWAFQFENDFYPDVDDTSMVLMALLRAGALDDPRYQERIGAAVNWTLGLQSSDGGWAAFDVDNNKLHLNNIPFADHGALLDPSTADLTGRCLEFLGMLGFDRSFEPAARGLEFLRKEQEADGSWYGRWGVNYLYGTWSVLMGLRQIGEDMRAPYVRRAVGWLLNRQNGDGGWGESCYSYFDSSLGGRGRSTPSQTAWALLGLMAAGEEHSRAVRRGIEYLVSNQLPDGNWDERLFTGTGFPRVFYLLYHGYSQYFPLWALGVYRRLSKGGRMRQDEMRLPNPHRLPFKVVPRT